MVARGDLRAGQSVTVQVIPMNVSQFQSRGLTPVPDVLNDPDLDPAEAGTAYSYYVKQNIRNHSNRRF